MPKQRRPWKDGMLREARMPKQRRPMDGMRREAGAEAAMSMEGRYAARGKDAEAAKCPISVEDGVL